MGHEDEPPESLGRFELLGAWLGLWTPPRGTDVPPIPWRRIAIGSAVLAVVTGAALAVTLPQLSDSKREARERDARVAAERRAEFLRMVDREQRPRTAQARPDPGAGIPAERRLATRAALLATTKAMLARDAEARTGRDIRGVECEPFPRTLAGTDPATALGRRDGAYDCVAVTARFDDPSGTGAKGIIGINFRVAVRFAAGTAAWCRIMPLGDRDRLRHPLPAACRVERPD